jgi:hypothetical protein
VFWIFYIIYSVVLIRSIECVCKVVSFLGIRETKIKHTVFALKRNKGTKY